MKILNSFLSLSLFAIVMKLNLSERKESDFRRGVNVSQPTNPYKNCSHMQSPPLLQYCTYEDAPILLHIALQRDEKEIMNEEEIHRAEFIRNFFLLREN